ncbi:MFS transporter [Methylocystis sp. FS]|jgi:DHA2 family multidrug resistance protein|uniref:MFS transporter n=1 Tax=Methylocystis TaxID=133 RepID=UPI001582C3B9|nr:MULTISPECIES: MFS transporter [Methylocystis]MBG0800017.1 MFS transporter [Methylocystis sp. H4A]NUJ81712.1 MFS transporter [Methylocystis silviterrae]
MKSIYGSPLRGWRFVLFNAALALGNIVVLSNVPGYTVLVPYAAGDLAGVTPSFGTWATTDHMIGLALGLPVARWFTGRFGDYRVYVATFAFYACASFVCATSETLWTFLPARIALGFAGGVILPVGQSLALKEYPERLRMAGVGLWGVLSMTPFTVGVFMGGWYAEYFGWRALFYSNIAAALPVAGIVGSLLYGRGFRRVITRFDGVGFFLLAGVLFGTQTILNQGNDFDWFASPLLTTSLIVVSSALPIFLIWEFGERHPVIDIRLFAYRNYAIATVCSIAGFLVVQGILSIFMGQLQTLLGYSSSLVGLIYLTMLIVAAPLVAVMHELNRKIDTRFVACLNFLCFAVTLTWLGLFDKPASFESVSVPMLFFGFSLATFFAPLAALAMHGLSGSKLVRAAEELAMLRTAAGAIGISSLAVVQFRRSPFHQLDLADHFGGRRFPSLDLVPQLVEQLQIAGFSSAAATKKLSMLIREEAALLAMNDAFLLGAVVFVVLAAFVWLAHPTPVIPLRRKEKLRQLRAEELMEQP